MIPQKKKSPEELAALRNELGIPASKVDSPPQQKPEPADVSAAKTDDEPSQPPPVAIEPSPPIEESQAQPTEQPRSLTPAEPKRNVSKRHSLRKQELPLAPAPRSQHKTELPSRRKPNENLAEIRKRQALANLPNQAQDPAAHLKKITAHPALLTPAYLFALGAAIAAWQWTHYLTPLCLIGASAILTLFIFATKKRSRHHAAILLTIIILILAFGGIRYAPLFHHAT